MAARSLPPISIPSPKERRRLLLVDSDVSTVTDLRHALESDGYQVIVAENASSARAVLRDSWIDLAILDLMLPDSDGLVLCSDIKTAYGVPIIVYSGTRRRRDAVLALRLGADDFVAKPFDLEDLEARIGAVLRRSVTSQARVGPSEPDYYQVGNLVVDRLHRRAALSGEEIRLTPTEYRLLSALASRPDEVFSREDLTQLAWGWADANRSRTVDTHIRRLRVKLQSASVPPPPIICVRGTGYKISTRESNADADMSSVA
jgi:DNA-binding response OmpR family regulator